MASVTALLARRLGWLARLRRSRSGNTLAMLAIAIVPLTGLVGGAVDASRLYLTKVRLQHACDAGALAGRKQMGGGTWQFSNFQARAVANEYFDANFRNGDYGSERLDRNFTERAGKVTGTAAANVPMTLMQVFSIATQRLTVTCDAEMRLPNTDVMFVLDTTGSMDRVAASTDSETKMVSLRRAVKCFYEIVARLDTNANCDGGAPSGGTSDTVQIRFGFMPYSTNVNVGYLLPTDYIADEWTYQSRMPLWTVNTTESWPQISQVTTRQAASLPSAQRDCTDANARAAYNRRTDTTVGDLRTVVETTAAVDRWASNICYGTLTTVTTIYRRTATQTRDFAQWRYDATAIDISGLKDGNNWAASRSFNAPVGAAGTDRSITWDGCIEERKTLGQNDWRRITTRRDIDEAPTMGDAATQWGPALQQLIYLRQIQTVWSQANRNRAETTLNYYNNGPYFCPTEARKLQEWPNASAFDAYVDSLVPDGNTYHDIGMLWGARFISPTGIFRSENEFTRRGSEIERHMIFMTDGDAVSAPCDYTAYGVAFFDRRTTNDVGSASACPDARGALNNQVNDRLDALCDVVKNMNVTLWVISFGNGSNAATEERLEECATSGRYFTARDSSALQATFRQIADEISQLRLTQ